MLFSVSICFSVKDNAYFDKVLLAVAAIAINIKNEYKNIPYPIVFSPSIYSEGENPVTRLKLAEKVL